MAKPEWEGLSPESYMFPPSIHPAALLPKMQVKMPGEGCTEGSKSYKVKLKGVSWED